MATIAIVYHSTYGHTKLQAEAVAAGAAGVSGVEVKIYTAEEATANLDELDGADAIIFGTATYMGNISAGLKGFMEASAVKWFPLAWKDKIAGGFSNSSSFSGDKLNTLQGIVVFAMQHGMIYVGVPYTEPALSTSRSGGTPYGPTHVTWNRDADSLSDEEKQLARALGQRVAEIARRLGD